MNSFPSARVRKTYSMCSACTQWKPPRDFDSGDEVANMIALVHGMRAKRRGKIGPADICNACALDQYVKVIKPTKKYIRMILERRHTPELRAQIRASNARDATGRRRALEKKAMPRWVSRPQIAEVYRAAREIEEKTGVPHHVDHIVPLQHPLVCGLHVPWNLRPIPASENMSKSNRFDGDADFS